MTHPLREINLHAEVTVCDVSDCFLLGWQLSLVCRGLLGATNICVKSHAVILD